jgi:hypothetical protein
MSAKARMVKANLEKDNAVAKYKAAIAVIEKAYAEGFRTAVDAQARGMVCDDKALEEAWRLSRTLKSLKMLK